MKRRRSYHNVLLLSLLMQCVSVRGESVVQQPFVPPPPPRRPRTESGSIPPPPPEPPLPPPRPPPKSDEVELKNESLKKLVQRETEQVQPPPPPRPSNPLQLNERTQRSERKPENDLQLVVHNRVSQSKDGSTDTPFIGSDLGAKSERPTKTDWEGVSRSNVATASDTERKNIDPKPETPNKLVKIGPSYESRSEKLEARQDEANAGVLPSSSAPKLDAEDQTDGRQDELREKPLRSKLPDPSTMIQWEPEGRRFEDRTSRQNSQPNPRRHNQYQYENVGNNRRPNPKTNPSREWQNARPLNQPPPRRATERKPAKSQWQLSGLRNVWKTVEKGLDSLADLEETVADRAKQVMSATVSTVWSTPSSPTDFDVFGDVPDPRVLGYTRLSRRRRAKNSAADSEKAPQMDMSRFQHTSVPKGNDNRKTASKSPWVKIANDQTKATEGQGDRQDLGRNRSDRAVGLPRDRQYTTQNGMTAKSDGNAFVSDKTSVMIRANGGASLPHDEHRGQANASPGSLQNAENRRPFTILQSDNSGRSRRGPEDSMRFPSEQNPILDEPTRTDLSVRVEASTTDERVNRAPAMQRLGISNDTPVRPIRPSQSSQRGERQDIDDDDKVSFAARLARALPAVPRLNLRLNPFSRDNSLKYLSSETLDAWKADDEATAKPKGLFGFLRRETDADHRIRRTEDKVSQQDHIPTPLMDLMERSDDGKSTALLTLKDRHQCASAGRTQALFDAMSLSLLVLAVREIPNLDQASLPQSVTELLVSTAPAVLVNIASSLETWAPFAFAAAFLAYRSRQIFLSRSLSSMSRSVEVPVHREAEYGSLFLRLTTSTPTNARIPERMRLASRAQIKARIDAIRMTSFVAILLASSAIATLKDLPLIAVKLSDLFQDIASIAEWREWPPQWRDLFERIVSVLSPFGSELMGCINRHVAGIIADPFGLAFELTILVSLCAVATLPTLSSRAPALTNTTKLGEDEEEDTVDSFQKFTEQISSIGASSACRLSFLRDHAIESLLDRWQLSIPRIESSVISIHFKLVCRFLFYALLSTALLCAPFIVGTRMDKFSSAPATSMMSWNSLADTMVVLGFTQCLVWKSVWTTVRASSHSKKIEPFLTSLRSILEDRKTIAQGFAGLELQASISPSAGLVVRDLWAAHTTRRAWALRGVNLVCRNGETLVVLGDDGAGKTRMMTSVAEAILSPSKASLTLNRVRGSVSVSAVDVKKWESTKLRKRVGVLLRDVRMESDAAQILSGLTLDEILEPSGQNGVSGSGQRAALKLALRITGLDTSLLPRLPSKLSTVVTANEEDMQPSPLRPRYYVLSPSEWSKLLLAKVLAQAIVDNDNAVASNDSLDNCLLGSLLLLDDVTTQLSEVEEARLLRHLRQAGAATVVTSHRWAAGRLADTIVVVRDGTVAESGTHGELLARGPQQSLYAATWYAMSAP